MSKRFCSELSTSKFQLRCEFWLSAYPSYSFLSTFCKSVSFIFSNPPVFRILHRRLDCSWYKIQFTMACNPTKTQVSCVYVLQIQDSPRRPCTAYISLCRSLPLSVTAGSCKWVSWHLETLHTSSHIFTQFPAQNQGFMHNAIIRQKKDKLHHQFLKDKQHVLGWSTETKSDEVCMDVKEGLICANKCSSQLHTQRQNQLIRTRCMLTCKQHGQHGHEGRRALSA